MTWQRTNVGKLRKCMHGTHAALTAMTTVGSMEMATPKVGNFLRVETIMPNNTLFGKQNASINSR